jgi:putative mRNA 3-end processing factor
LRRLEDYSSILRKAGVNSEGAILLGKNLCCDGYDRDRKAAALTHMHQDHMAGFEHLLGHCEQILMTHATRDLVIALKGQHLRFRRNLIGLDCEKPAPVEDDKVTFYPNGHILGACQVLLEDVEGCRLLYSGDFDLSTRPPKADVLVLDATYGDPEYVFPNDRSELEKRLIDIVKSELGRKRSVVILTHRGKMQYLMHLAREQICSEDLTFLASSIDLRLADVYEKYDHTIGKRVAANSTEGRAVISNQTPFLAFFPIGSALKDVEGVSYTRIKVSAYGARQPIVRFSDSYYLFAVSDHADFNGILEYVKECDPKVVIVDAKRSGGNATAFAQEIEKRYPTISACGMP